MLKGSKYRVKKGTARVNVTGDGVLRILGFIIQPEIIKILAGNGLTFYLKKPIYRTEYVYTSTGNEKENECALLLTFAKGIA